MADINYAGIIRAATSLNQCMRYEDGSNMYDVAGKLIIYFNNEPAAESVEIPIIFESGNTKKHGVIIISRNGRHRFVIEEEQA